MKRGPLEAALLCAALGLGGQLLTVHFNYRGSLTALFCHGSQVATGNAIATWRTVPSTAPISAAPFRTCSPSATLRP